MAEIKFDPVSCNWGTITELGIFTRRPWWQRALSLFVRKWRRTDAYVATGVLEGTISVAPIMEGSITISASTVPASGNTTTNADVPFTYTGGDHA